jgi:excisionase family DNA binding protein
MHEVMTPDEVAALLKLHVKTVYRLARQGVLPGRQIGRHWRFSRAEILALVSRHPDGLDGDGAGAVPARRTIIARRRSAP